jgi:RNA polymerase sigma factor (sigma-70 family)
MDRVTENSKYFENMVKKVSYSRQWPRHQEQDVLQMVLLALCELEAGNSAAGFVPWEEGHGKEWLSYMHGVAQTVITRYINERQDTVIPLSRHLGEEWAAARRVRGELAQELKREPRNRLITTRLGMTLDQYESLRTKADYEAVYGEDLATGDSDSACLEEDYVGFEEMIDGSGVIPSPHFLVERDELLGRLNAALDTLDVRERKLLEAHFGLDDQGDGKTLREIAIEEGVIFQRVHFIIQRAIGKLYRQMEDIDSDDLDMSLAGRTSA